MVIELLTSLPSQGHRISVANLHNLNYKPNGNWCFSWSSISWRQVIMGELLFYLLSKYILDTVEKSRSALSNSSKSMGTTTD